MSCMCPIPPSPPPNASSGGPTLSLWAGRLDRLLVLSLQVDRLLLGLRWQRLEEPLGFIKVLQWVSRP